VSLPKPRPGLVIRYSFLWSHEHDRGLVEGSKDRPCAIIVAMARVPKGDIQTIVAPITHRPPVEDGASLEIPSQVCRSLGLDAGKHWLRLDELNRFVWPGYDLRARADDPSKYEYGMLPQNLFEQLQRKILERQRLKKAKIIPRTE
jgi:hypothetical protein